MRIFLVLLKINSDCQWHVGLAYLSAKLKKAGHEVELFELGSIQEQKQLFLERVKEFNPDLIGISANSHQFQYVGEVAGLIKNETASPIFLGGLHTTLNPEVIAELKNIKGVCVGEGEEAFLELVEKLAAGKELKNIKNFWLKEGKEVFKNECRPLVEDLDLLPYPDRAIFDYFKDTKTKKTPRFIFSRGCPFDCAYCCNHALKKIYKGLGRYVRFRSVKLAIAEIEAERQKYDFSHFKLDDDTFSLNKDWLKELCAALAAKNWGLTFECNIRPGTIDEEGMAALKKAGCILVKIGVETGNEALRRNVLNRNFSNEDIIKTFKLAQANGIRTFSFNMVGVPGETRQTIKETIDLNAAIKPDLMQVTIFFPYRGTVLGDLCFQQGYVSEHLADTYMEKSSLRLPGISRRAIEWAARSFKFRVYWRYDKKKAWQEIVFIIKKFILSNRTLHALARKVHRLAKAGI